MVRRIVGGFDVDFFGLMKLLGGKQSTAKLFDRLRLACWRNFEQKDWLLPWNPSAKVLVWLRAC